MTRAKNGVNTCPPISEYKTINAPKFTPDNVCLRPITVTHSPSQNLQPVREAVSYRGLFTAGWFGVREKHCSQLEIYDRLRASEQAGSSPQDLNFVVDRKSFKDPRICYELLDLFFFNF